MTFPLYRYVWIYIYIYTYIYFIYKYLLMYMDFTTLYVDRMPGNRRENDWS